MVNILPQVFALFCIFPTMKYSLKKVVFENLQKINSDSPTEILRTLCSNSGKGLEEDFSGLNWYKLLRMFQVRV